MYFSKVLHGVESGNAGDLDTARSLYIKILCVRARSLSFFVRQGKVPGEIPDNLAESRDCITEDTECRFPMKKTGQIYNFQLKYLQKLLLGLEESHADVEVAKLKNSEHFCKSYRFLNLKTEYL